MYLDFFGLEDAPFNNTPDVKYLYLSSQHREALAHMLYGIKEKKGFVTITGEIGAGKTTICRALLNELDPKTKVAIIFNSFISELELLKTINQELFLDFSSDSKKDLIDQLNQFLLEQHSISGNVVLIIDEAQNLSNQVLEQIRMLSNLETENEKLLQIILVGQPELQEMLQQESLKQLKQRVSVHYHLSPLDLNESREYILHRLKIAGLKQSLEFSEESFESIYSYSRGIPRMINNICDRTLLLAYTRETHSISSNIVREALDEVSFEKKKKLSLQTARSYSTWSVLAVLFTLLIILVWWFYTQIDIIWSSPEFFQTVTYTPIPQQMDESFQKDERQKTEMSIHEKIQYLINLPRDSISVDRLSGKLNEQTPDKLEKTLLGLFYVYENRLPEIKNQMVYQSILDNHYNIMRKENLCQILARLQVPYISFIDYNPEHSGLPVVVLAHDDLSVRIFNPLFDDIVEQLPRSFYETIKYPHVIVIYPNWVNMTENDLTINSREIYTLKELFSSLGLYHNPHINTFVDEELVNIIQEICSFFEITFAIPLEKDTREKLDIVINLMAYCYRTSLIDEIE